jgi:hypothetical protein
MDVGFPRPKIPTLQRVIKQTPDTVTVVLVVLCCVNPSLRCNRMSPSRAVMKTKGVHLVPQLRQARRRRGPGQAGTHNDDPVFPLIARRNQPDVGDVLGPLLCKWPRGDPGVKLHVTIQIVFRDPATRQSGSQCNQ